MNVFYRKAPPPPPQLPQVPNCDPPDYEDAIYGDVDLNNPALYGNEVSRLSKQEQMRLILISGLN